MAQTTKQAQPEKISRREAIDALLEWKDLHAARMMYERLEREKAEVIRQFLEQEGENSLFDVETGFGVRLQTRQQSPTYDLASMPPHLRERLYDLGCLTVNVKVLREQTGNGQLLRADVAKYEIPGPVSYALVEAK